MIVRRLVRSAPPLVLVFWVSLVAGRAATAGQNTTPELTQHEIVPILRLRCTVCHGHRTKEAGLDLRSKASMLRGGKSGPAIVLGKPDESLVIQKIRSGEMPPNKRLIEVGVKPMSSSELGKLERWIELGAPEVHVEPDVPTTEPDPLVDDADRQFWAFQPPKRPKPPAPPSQGAEKVEHWRRTRNPIDAFVLRKLDENGLTLAPEADRLTLMRRASFDLTGLPPEPEDVAAFLHNDDPLAYEKMVERLLASPRYGERWGRHWLDLAGYADSEGKRSADPVRPYAYRYRDYVIQSFNADKPYDRFLLEQIAGDELADYENAPEITRELYDNLVATGFLRMAPDGTGSDVVNFVPERLEVMADEIDVLGSAVLGLTLKCARCHDHKYDPIPQRDYYRLVDTFKGAYDEHDWLKPAFVPGQTRATAAGRVLAYVTEAERTAWEQRSAQLQAEIDSLKTELAERAAALKKKYFDERLAELPEAIRDDVRAAIDTPVEQRGEVQRYLAEKFEQKLHVNDKQLLKLDADYERQFDRTQREIKEIEQQQRREPKIRALWDRGEPSPTYIYVRGDYLRPGALVGPGVPSVLTDGRTPFEVKPPWPGAKKTGRRLALAKWLTKPDHPLTARVMVNRIWKLHFGEGLVKSSDNFGNTGTPPSHPELLDWLATEFVRQGWSIKAMHRLMMTSATYRQMSTPGSPSLQGGVEGVDGLTLDPENKWLSHMPIHRLDAEALRDTLLLVAGRLDLTRYGPPDDVQVRKDGLVTSVQSAGGWRRSIYVRQRRKEIPTLLENFDLPQMNPNCVDRPDSTVASQALHLWNNAMIHELAESFAHRVYREAGDEPAHQVEQVYLIALGRPATEEEKAIALEALEALRAAYADSGDHEAVAQQALTAYCHTILNSAAFLYID